MATPVTDPALLAQLNAGDTAAPAAAGPRPVTDPAILQQLNAPATPEARPGMTGYAASRARNPNTHVDEPGINWNDVTAGVSQFAQGVNKPVYGTIGALADLIPDTASRLTGGPGMRPVTNFLQKYAYPTPPEALEGHPALRVAREAGNMVGNNIGPQAVDGGLANAGVRSGVTLAEQAAPGVLNKIRGAGDKVLDWVAQNPGKAFTTDTAGATESGAGGQIGTQIGENEGWSPDAKVWAERVGQLATPFGVNAWAKVSPTANAPRAAGWLARKTAEMVPENVLPESWQTGGTPQSRAADRLAYANREGPYANPDTPPPAEPNWAVRQMDKGAARRTEAASGAVRDEMDQITARPEAAANMSIADQLKQNVPGFAPGLAKETGDPALLKLHGRLEGQATGNTLRDLQGNYDKSAQAIKDKFNGIAPAAPENAAPPQDVVAQSVRDRVKSIGDRLSQQGEEVGQQVGQRQKNVQDVLTNEQANTQAQLDQRQQAAQARLEQQRGQVTNQIRQTSDQLPETDPSIVGNHLRETRATLRGQANDQMDQLRRGIAHPEDGGRGSSGDGGNARADDDGR